MKRSEATDDVHGTVRDGDDEDSLRHDNFIKPSNGRKLAIGTQETKCHLIDFNYLFNI